MKKMMIVLLSALLIASFAACGAQTTAVESSSAASSPAVSSSGASDSTPSASGASSEANDESSDDASAHNGERLIIADAAQFRGVVEEFAVNDAGQTVLLMRRANGTGFDPTLKATLTDDTKYSFDSKGIGNGAFLEIYYGGEPAGDQSVDAIAVNDLMSEDLVNYNGTLVEIIPDDSNEGSGQLLLDPIDANGMQYVFLYAPETQFHLDFASLKKGDKLNIFHSPISTRSLPPQSPALEVSAYTAPAEGEQPIPSGPVSAALGTPENPIAEEPIADASASTAAVGGVSGPARVETSSK